ncbi:MAG: hypothetical protein MJZ68_00490 [archaeon]|nr:hypothetical protein [archaeon]
MHCKDISVRSVDVDLTAENIAELMKDWRAYKRAAHLVLEHEGGYAVVRIDKAMGEGLFGKVSDYEIVSLPENTVYVEIPDMDVLNVPALARLQSSYPGKAVVVKGLFSHISFVKDMEPLKLRVLDSVPPHPSKLGHLTKIALASGYVELPVVTEDVIIDFSVESRKAETEEVMFPCEGSATVADKKYCYLDKVPNIEGRDITLVGCRLSKRIFTELYGKEVPFINVCPKDNVPDDGMKTIVKCCRVKSGHEIDGNVVMVPWGATVPEVVEAIKAIFSEQ